MPSLKDINQSPIAQNKSLYNQIQHLKGIIKIYDNFKPSDLANFLFRVIPIINLVLLQIMSFLSYKFLHDLSIFKILDSLVYLFQVYFCIHESIQNFSNCGIFNTTNFAISLKSPVFKNSNLSSPRYREKSRI